MATTTQETQLGFAPAVEPYAMNLLGAAQAQTLGTPGHTDANGNWVAGTQPTGYNSYADWAINQGLSGDQIAQFSGLQQQAYKNAGNLGLDPRSTDAASGISGLATRLQNQSYNGSQYGNQFANTGNFGYAAQNAQAANAGYAPQGQAATSNAAPSASAAQLGSAPTMQGAQGNWNPYAGLNQYQMAAPERVSSQDFGQPSADKYMSPYMQSVVEKQQRDAQRQADIATTQRNAAATGAGAFGGSRQAIMDAEAARNLAQQKGDIQATGLQNAYSQAQQQFNTDQARGLQAQQSNQGAGLTAGGQNLNALLSTQALGSGYGQQMNMANLSNQQAANQANQAMQGQYGLAQAGYGQQANLANQSMQGQYGLASLSNQQQMNLANQALQGQYGLTNAGYQQQANMANQAAQNQAMQFGAGQNFNAANAAAQYGQSANQLNAQQQQFGANFGLQGLQGSLGAYNNLGSLGQNLYGQTTGNINLQAQLGGQQQQQAQNMINANYQNYTNEMNYPYKQMGFLSDIVRGVPVQQTGATMYTPPPSTLQTVAGLGSLYQGLTGKKRGGHIKERNGGLNALALSSM